MKKILFFITLCSIVTVNTIDAATVLKGKKAAEKISNSEIVRFKDFTSVPNYVKFIKGKEIPLAKLDSWLKQFYPFGSKYGIKLVKKEVGTLGMSHYRYKQTFNGIPIELSAFIAHVNNGLVVSINGEFLSNVNSTTSASLTEAAALNKALGHINAEIYKWEIIGEEDHLKMEQKDPTATYFPTGELVLINEKGQINQTVKLAYKFNIYAQKPISRREIYVDATSGEIIWEQSKIHHADAVGSATTAYSGVQTMTADNNGGTFRLRETGRGNGIETYDMNMGTNYGAAVDFTDNDNNWNNVNADLDEYATDAHWGSEMTYDYFLNVHSRNSIDGAGYNLISYIHFDLVAFGYPSLNNAFWDGQRMTYGDGEGGLTPLTSIDIAGHEITHGLTSNTANLIYQDESGALNESFSDIFGVSIDWFARPGSANWTMGEEIGSTFRSMSNPGTYNDPDTYFGNNWQPLGGADNGGVHSNSGVQNFWYYLLANGGTGTNDNTDNYTVTGLGLTDASRIAFRNLTVYLTQSSDFSDARFYAIQSAIDLFGSCTTEVGAVTNAWYAVGVGPAYSPNTVSDFTTPIVSSCSIPFTTNFTNNSVNGVTYNWDFGDGNNSTQTNPSNTYTNYGTYTVELIANGGATCGIDTNIKLAYIIVDSTLACVTILPTSGTVSTQTSCTGTIYDSGGAAGNYGASEDVQITIAPPGAGSVDLTFVTFDVEAGQAGACNYDYVRIFDGPNIGSPQIGSDYCNNNIPTTVSSTSGSITIVFHSDGGVEDPGFQIDWQCQMPSQVPTVDFTVDVDTTCTGSVNFTDLSNNGPTAWIWDFGDGSGSTQQNPGYTYPANGLYTVELTSTNGIGNGNLIKTSYIFVDMPTAPATTGDVICENNTANLGATGAGTLNWYAAATGGSILNSGGNYATASLPSTTTYYVEDVIVSPNQNMGKVDNTGGGGNFNNLQHLIFDVYQPLEIVSVEVYSGAAGNRTIELRDAGGSVLQSTVVNIANGTQTVTLNFSVTPGTDYQLGVSNTSNIDMYRNNAGVNYPYTLNGMGSVTRSSANQNGGLDHYYFFYDWTVKAPDCISPRTAVTATVNAAPTVVANSTAMSVCPGNAVTLTGTGATSYTWDNGVTDGVAFTPGSTTTYTVIGIDGNSCQNTDQITITINPLPNVVANSTAAAVCPGDPVTLTGTGATSYTWDNGVNDGVAFVPGSTTTYTVTGTDANSCQNTDQIIVTVNSTLPVVANATATTICAGDPVTLTGTGAASYVWDNGVTDGVVFNPIVTTTYNVIGTSGSCSNSDQITVTVNALPNITANSTAVLICPGDSITLTGSGGTSYVWDNGATDGMQFAPGSTTTYTVTGTDVNNCQNTDQILVTVDICAGINEFSNGGEITSFINASNNLELGLIKLEKGNYTLVVLNPLGQVVVSKQISINLTQQTESVQMQSKAKGLYFVKLYNTKNNYTSKVVK